MIFHFDESVDALYLKLRDDDPEGTVAARAVGATAMEKGRRILQNLLMSQWRPRRVPWALVTGKEPLSGV